MGSNSETEVFEFSDSLWRYRPSCRAAVRLNSPTSSKKGIRHRWCSLPFSSFDPFFKAPQHRVGSDRCSTHVHLALRASLSCLGSFSEVTADKFSSLISFPSLSIFLRPLAPAIVTRLRSVWLVLAASQFACATTDALTPAPARFFGRSSRHELRSLTHGQVSHVCRLSL